MSEETPQEENKVEEAAEEQGPQELKLSGLFAHKVGMSAVYNDKGEVVTVTVLKYEPWKVSQIKTTEKDGYDAVQIASGKKSPRKSSGSQKGHLKAAGYETNAQVVREVRGAIPENAVVGETVSINSFAKGDRVRLTSRSKGRGFTGVMKRYGFAGGPASHGSGFHRRPGSIGNCEEPGRVMPGRKMPGQFGDVNITVKHAEIVEVLPEENVLLVKGPVPGARNSLVKLVKE